MIEYELKDIACELKAKGCKLRVMTLLREPVERVISSLIYNHKGMPDDQKALNMLRLAHQPYPNPSTDSNPKPKPNPYPNPNPNSNPNPNPSPNPNPDPDQVLRGGAVALPGRRPLEAMAGGVAPDPQAGLRRGGLGEEGAARALVCPRRREHEAARRRRGQGLHDARTLTLTLTLKFLLLSALTPT